MGAGDALSLWGLILVMLPGVLGHIWNVQYQDTSVCTVRGSTVFIYCKYDYPDGYTIKETMWCQKDIDCIDTSYVCHSENYNLTEPRPGQSEKMEAISHRAECLGGKKKNCTLKISNTRKTDAGEYRFRFRSNAPRGQWTGQSGVKLYVHDDSHMTTTLVIVGVVLFVLVVVFLVAIVVKRMKGSRLRKETSRTVKTQIADEHVHVPGTESTHPPSMALGLDTSPREEGVSYAALHFDTKPPVKRPVETEQTQQESVIYSSVLTATNRVK
ncbi:uncharacterized protein LOC125746328 isoform X4 [Brienomyrus brachyistius]|uniref:uncharacterized protein LOC125746328 isoform X4 n=1 Tax=Brienomyrus brachyistius TaxID=42636 RepID=UPI0020B2C990|nr:uncharacterized protein LOC125746328 isoform X4 [Brienomyrus brachyistius]